MNSRLKQKAEGLIVIRKFICDEEGQDVIEWALLAAFLSVLMITAVTTIAPIILTWYDSVKADITGAPAP